MAEADDDDGPASAAAPAAGGLERYRTSELGRLRMASRLL